ncbi:MAG: hypothetical protein C4547_16580 [Phycisphaerales bacterium]|nr:MAG: hypothetical protein C4547_16580 [Phycisphaerales bacterium]
MTMFISSLTDTGATPALVRTMSFTHARLAMISENVANYGTPHYRPGQLDTRGFQRALRRALDERGGEVSKPLKVESGRQVRTLDDGSIEVTPSKRPVENILFHDDTQASIERQMSDLAETGMTQELMATLLRSRIDSLEKAIRGTV